MENIIYFDLFNVLKLILENIKKPLLKRIVLPNKYIKRIKVFNKKYKKKFLSYYPKFNYKILLKLNYKLLFELIYNLLEEKL